jgi:hypothetical protein
MEAAYSAIVRSLENLLAVGDGAELDNVYGRLS